MKDKAKLINNAKNCIIAVLFVSSIFLLFKAVFYESSNDLSKMSSLFSGNSGKIASVSPGTESSELKAEPVFILVTAKDGSHYSIKYDSQSKNEMFSKFSAALGEALGSSGEPAQISMENWQKVLGGSGVFFDYLYPQPLAYIANCLGTQISGSASSKTARRLFLGGDNDKLVLYYIDESDGLFYSCNTASSFSTISSKIAEFPLGTANFAFEEKDYSSLDPYFIFSHESGKIREISAANPLRSDFSPDDLLGLFGINSRTVNPYHEDDGSEVYVEGGKTLRIEASGKVLFSVTGNDGIPITSSSGDLTISDCLSVCSSITEKSVGLMSGDGNIGLAKILNSSVPSSSEISFGYFVGGIPISLPDANFAADFQINNGVIIRAELYFRKYTFSGNTIMALPEKQATAIAEPLGGEPVLVYEDKIDGISATWIIN